MSSQAKKNQKKNVPKKQVVSAPRRGGYKKKNVQASKRLNVPGKIKESPIATADNVQYQKAQGDRTTIMADVTCVPTAVQCFPLAFVSVALAMGYRNTDNNPIYAAYSARLIDFIALMSGGTPTVPSRLAFENMIDASYLPKTIRLKTGTISTKWVGIDSVVNAPDIVIRGYHFSMYVPTAATLGNWKVFGPPSPVPAQEQVSLLATLYNYISSDLIPHLRYVTNVDLLPEYKQDMSGFGASSLYYGGGNSDAGGPSKSVEWECPVKAPILASIAQLGGGDPRVARHLKLTGGDSTFINGVALFPSFTPDTFKSKIGPVFCYLDLDEVVRWLLDWYVALVQQAGKTSNSNQLDGVVFPYFSQFTCSAQAFRIAVRQVILSMFVQSQAAAQFITYATGTRDFEPLKVGTNCYSRVRNTMTAPLLLIENIRMLMPRFLEMKGKLARSHNKQVYVPVWGVYREENYKPYNPTAVLYGEGGFVNQTLFPGDIDTDDPGVIDGFTSSGACLDLNSNFIAEIIDDWNDRIEGMAGFSMTTGYFGGASAVSLLGYTRFAEYKTNFQTPIPLSKLTRLQKKYIDPRRIEKRKIQRTLSKKDMEEVSYYIPPDGTLETQFTVSYSSIFTITETAKRILNYFIFPVVVTTPGELPTARQVRTNNLQSHILEYGQIDDEFSVDSRAVKIKDLAMRCAPGIATAGKSDELTATLQAFSEENKGGFFGTLAGVLFPSVAPVTNLLPF